MKIAWTLRADPISERESIFRTETRAVATVVRARQISAVLVVPVAGHHPDSVDVARAGQSGGRSDSAFSQPESGSKTLISAATFAVSAPRSF